MTTDQEKSATPSTDAMANPYKTQGSLGEAWRKGFGGERCLGSPNSNYERVYHEGAAARQVFANIQLREELKLAELRAKMVPRPYADAHLMQGEIEEYKNKLSAATEQLAIAQAREVLYRTFLQKTSDMSSAYQVGLRTEISNLLAKTASSRTALDEEIRKARVQALEDAATDCDEWATAVKNVGMSKHRDGEILGYKNAAQSIRDMANSLIPTSQQESSK